MADTDYPLLVFPDPVPADRGQRTGGGGKLRRPRSQRYRRQRLVPQFQRLQEIRADILAWSRECARLLTEIPADGPKEVEHDE